MLKTNREKRICEKYRARDSEGHVHCCECPLRVREEFGDPYACRANCRYDRKKRAWVYELAAEEMEVKGDEDT